MYRALFDRLDEPVEIRDAQGRCVARNPAAARTPLPEDAVERAMAKGSTRLRHGGRAQTMRAVRLDSSHVAVRLLPDSDSEELDRLLGRMAHDMTEPLRLVTMYSQLLARQLGPSLEEAARSKLDVVLTQVARMQRAIDDLLELSRVDRLGAVEEPVALHPLVGEVVGSLGEEARDAHIVWEGLPVVCGSTGLLGRVVARLIDNALRYRSEAPPQIRIHAEQRRGRWWIAFRDNGIGVDPAHHESIFEPFGRLHAYDERPGTGIGLAFCRRAAERMGGSLHLDSKPGEGSRFTLELRPA